MRKLITLSLSLVVMAALATPAFADGMNAEDAFEQLKSLAGTWKGSPMGEGPEADAEAEEAMAGKAVHDIQVSAAGTVVMETMSPGTPHEMINMYHLDGEELVLTHYCAGGNQPTMRLDRAKSSADKFVFEFTGGTNLDPAVDSHIHSAKIEFMGEDKMDSVWYGYQNGEQAGIMTFHLAKVD